MILGINTADMSAFNLIGKIRDDFDALILVISNSNDELALVKALSLGADKYIVKPFNKRMFMAFVKAVYRKYKGLHWPKGHSTLSALF
jgi:DNA-binding response OmpR family regulator